MLNELAPALAEVIGWTGLVLLVFGAPAYALVWARDRLEAARVDRGASPLPRRQYAGLYDSGGNPIGRPRPVELIRLDEHTATNLYAVEFLHLPHCIVAGVALTDVGEIPFTAPKAVIDGDGLTIPAADLHIDLAALAADA